MELDKIIIRIQLIKLKRLLLQDLKRITKNNKINELEEIRIIILKETLI